MKKDVRERYVYRFVDHKKILIVNWVENKCITIGTNYDKVEPTCNVQRWSKGTK